MAEPNIVLVRIDNRLIHGQVATAWAQYSGANLLLVPNDDVAQNTTRQGLMNLAAPKGAQTRYFSIQKTIDVIHKAAPRQLIAIIAETPQDVLKLVEGGVPIKKVNIGNMHMSEGKTQISKAVCVDQCDIDTFKKLSQYGVKLEIQRVPTEGKEDILSLIK
ncbi:PTS N-acetylgalactosamine transporter subunit IIB [uncultured Cetobacterium sp.]|uniref:PTS N-acetylgalactosamine transporter subunit IIB n=1 Tax=uncultured Cetobacterium sp. TaxID=527638 RepID=UPI00261CF694|nr:PTS N-acetylgalactosamine transporter subunit IIB [uncultured Cetobacterium sp.]